MRYLIILLSWFSVYSMAQPKKYLTEVVEKPYRNFSRIDNHFFFSLDSRRKSIFFDEKVKDSTGGYILEASLIDDNLHCFIERKEKHLLLSIGMDGAAVTKSYPKSLNLFYTPKNVYCLDRIHYDSIDKIEFEKKLIGENEYRSRGFSPFNKRIYKINLHTQSKENIISDLDIKFKDSLYSFTDDQIQMMYDLDDSRLLIETGYCVFGGCDNVNYFICDKKNGATRRLRHIFKREYDQATNRLFFYCSDTESKYHLAEYGDYGVRNEDHKGYFIFDSNVQIVSRALPRNARNIGYNYVNGKIDSYNIKSRFDDDRSAIVAFRLSLPQERTLLRIFNNEEILSEDLNQLDKYSFNILRGSIYAKHNFKFVDPFYEAYFNLFDFYDNEEKKSLRLTSVDNLFTPMDKKNLAIIDANLTRLKK